MRRLSARRLRLVHEDLHGSTAPWMRQLHGAVVNPEVHAVLVTMARGAGKTAAMGAVAGAVFEHECERGTGGDVLALAGGFEQARICIQDAMRVLEGKPGMRAYNSTTTCEVRHAATMSRLRAVSASKATSMGWRARMVVADEPATWPPVGRELLAAAITSRGKVPDSKVVIVGTRPFDPGHWWGHLLADPPENSVVLDWHAPDDADLLDVRAWHAANPSLRSLGLPSIDTLRSEALTAVRDPTAAATFKALRLNMGTPLAVENVLIAPEAWDALPPPGEPKGIRVFGIDLGGASSLSAVCCLWPGSGRLEAIAACGAEPPIAVRSKRCGLPGVLERAEVRGELLVTPGRNANWRKLLEEAEKRWGQPDVVVADTFRQAELRDVVDALAWPYLSQFIVRSGRDQNEDLARTVKVINGGDVRPVRTELLDVSVSQARVRHNSFGHAALLTNPDALDDLAAAMVLAVASGDRIVNA